MPSGPVDPEGLTVCMAVFVMSGVKRVGVFVSGRCLCRDLSMCLSERWVCKRDMLA